MARTLPDRCPSKHLAFTGIGLRHQRPALQQLDVRGQRDEFEAAMRAMRRISEPIHGYVLSAGLPRGAKVSAGPLQEQYCVG